MPNKEKTEKHKGGRPIPEERSTEKLRILLIRYKEKFGNKKITFSDLERAYNIPRHIWRDREEIRHLVDDFNTIDLGLNEVDILKNDVEMLPNLGEIVKDFSHDPKKLTTAIIQYEDFVRGLYTRCLEYSQYKKKYNDLEVEKSKIEETIETLMKEVKTYKDMYFKICSRNSNEWAKNKVIEFSKKEFESDFDDVFDFKKE